VWHVLRVVLTMACIALGALLATTVVMMIFSVPVQLLYILMG